MQDSREVTVLLRKWFEGSEDVEADLMPVLYRELRLIARRHMRKQRPGHTLQTTELVHEAFMKIASGNDQFWNNRQHFFAVAARAMRQILVDYARARLAEKRGGDPKKKELLEIHAVAKQKSSQLLELDAALDKLSTVCERKARVVELKFFGGFGISEIAKSLGVSDMTVKRDWRFARSWLLREMDRT